MSGRRGSAILPMIMANRSQFLRESRGPVYPRTPPAGALEIWIIGNHHVAALRADKPARALQHRPEGVIQLAIWASNNFVSHFEPSALSLSDQSGNSIRSAWFLSRSCSSARTFSSQYACRSATDLSTNSGE